VFRHHGIRRNRQVVYTARSVRDVTLHSIGQQHSYGIESRQSQPTGAIRIKSSGNSGRNVPALSQCQYLSHEEVQGEIHVI